MTHRTLFTAVTLLLLLTQFGCNTCNRRPLFPRLFKRSDATNRLDPPAPTRGSVDPFLIPPPQGGLPTVGLESPPAPRATTPIPRDIPPPSVPSMPENRSFRAMEIPPPRLPESRRLAPREQPPARVPETRQALPSEPPERVPESRKLSPSDLPPERAPERVPESRKISPSDLPPPTVPETRESTESRKDALLEPPAKIPESRKPDSPSNDASPNRSLPGFRPAPTDGTTQESKALTKDNAIVGVPGSNIVLRGVASGRKPSVEGFERLATAGYRTVLYLHAPGADTSAAKALTEKQKMIFEPIEITAETIGESYERFAKLINAPDRQPIYVCDDDGLRTGALWYIYFRLSQGDADDVAKVRADGLGLRGVPNDNALIKAAKDFLAKW